MSGNADALSRMADDYARYLRIPLAARYVSVNSSTGPVRVKDDGRCDQPRMRLSIQKLKHWDATNRVWRSKKGLPMIPASGLFSAIWTVVEALCEKGDFPGLNKLEEEVARRYHGVRRCDVRKLHGMAKKHGLDQQSRPCLAAWAQNTAGSTEELLGVGSTESMREAGIRMSTPVASVEPKPAEDFESSAVVDVIAPRSDCFHQPAESNSPEDPIPMIAVESTSANPISTFTSSRIHGKRTRKEREKHVSSHWKNTRSPHTGPAVVADGSLSPRDQLVNILCTGKKIVVVAGAGISTAAGGKGQGSARRNIHTDHRQSQTSVPRPAYSER